MYYPSYISWTPHVNMIRTSERSAIGQEILHQENGPLRKCYRNVRYVSNSLHFLGFVRFVRYLRSRRCPKKLSAICYIFVIYRHIFFVFFNLWKAHVVDRKQVAFKRYSTITTSIVHRVQYHLRRGVHNSQILPLPSNAYMAIWYANR